MLPLLQDYSNSVVSHYLHSLIPSQCEPCMSNSHHRSYQWILVRVQIQPDELQHFRKNCCSREEWILVLQQRLVEHNISRFSQLSTRLGKSNCFVDCLVERKVSRFSQLDIWIYRTQLGLLPGTKYVTVACYCDSTISEKVFCRRVGKWRDS